jgi:thiol peroxidase
LISGAEDACGPALKPGDKAPPFSITGPKNETIDSGRFAGKPLIISVIPSIDTGVCSRQTRRFNEAAAALGDRVNILAVSADLPFAQARWCGAEGIDRIVMGSDYKDMNFGDAYGTHVKELRWESRAAFVVAKDGVIRYAEYVPAGGLEPTYDAVLEVARGLI